jgi:hypothetical protein
MDSFAKRIKPLLGPLLLLPLAVAYAAFIARFAFPLPESDDIQYLQYAQGFYQTGVYGLEPGKPDSVREWGYGIFLGLLAKAHTLVFGAPDSISAWNRGLVQDQAFFAFLWAVFLLWALRKKIPPRQRGILAALLLFSPSILSMHSMVFSESLAFNCVLALLAGFLLQENKKNFAALALIFGAAFVLVSTKQSFKIFLPLAIVAGALYAARKIPRPLAPALLAFFLGLGAGELLWQARVNALGDRTSFDSRPIVQFSGRYLRAAELEFPADLVPGTIASVGISTCNKIYGEAHCHKFHYSRSDDLGMAFAAELRGGHSSLGDLWRKVRETWPLQIFATYLELVRLTFFEASPAGTGVGEIFSKAWHLLGSLLLGFLAFWGIKKSRPLSPALVASLVLALGYVALLSQTSNVARSIFPLLPIVYWFAAAGSASFLGEASES